MTTELRQAAYDIGAKGSEPTEDERLAFESWMRGHCWAVIGDWNGKQYKHDCEDGEFVHGGAMGTRRLWAAWRDRGALARITVEAQQVAVPAWAATADKMPEPLNNVLAFSGKKQPIRAMWVPAKTLEDSGDGDFGEYDEATDQTYWPEGWYETNAYEETHWLVDGQVTHWMPLPAAPQGAKP